MSIEIRRYFEVAHPNPVVSNYYLQETMTWEQTTDDDPRGVNLVGQSGKFVWTFAANPVQLIPSIADPAYWDYYALPPNPAFSIVRELTEAEWDTEMATLEAQLAVIKG